MKVETVDGLALHTSGRPAGPTVVLLHGFTGSAAAWPRPALRELETRVRVVRVDLPGHGAATVDPADPSAWTPERTAARLAAVADRVGPGARWAGYSMGGRMALLARLRGVPMGALLLESSSPGLAEPAERAERRERDEALARRIEAAPLEDFVDRWMALPLFATQRRLDAGVLETERRRRLACDPAGLAAALRGFGTGSQPSLWDELDGIGVELRILTGALDTRYTAIGARMAEALSPSSHRVIPGAGHAVHLEAPDGWAEWILEAMDA